MKDLSFTLKLEEVPVSITDAKGTDRTYTLRELSGKQRGKYLNDMGGRMKFNIEGKTEGLTDYEGVESGLLSLCLHDENGVLVEKSVLEEYPSRVLADLFGAAQELSGLDKGAKDEAKKDSKVKDSTGIDSPTD